MERERPETIDRKRAILKLGVYAMQGALTHLEALISGERQVTGKWWRQQQSYAEQLAHERRENPEANRVLLVIAAQHPLINGREPNEEFKARLLAGAERAKELAAHGIFVEIYIPGSRHMDNGLVDDIALADAGGNFLAAEGDLPDSVVVHGSNLNAYYKGEDGVYNSGDEAFVAMSYFKDTPAFGTAEVFVGPQQKERWELHAIGNGVAPTFHAVTPPSGETFHAKPSSAESKMVAYTRYFDPTWQHPKSFMARTTRLLRKPKES